MKAILMAGGRGTRIASVDAALPKPMLPVCGKPILQYQVEWLAENGIGDITLVTGHLGDTVAAYFGDGSQFGVRISYFHEPQPLGTAGALYHLRESADDETLLLNGDLVFDIDLDRMLGRHREAGAEATIFTHPNSHPNDSALIVTDADGRVTRWIHKEQPRGDCKNRVNAGIHILTRRALARVAALQKADLDRDVLAPMAADGTLFAYDSPEYVFDVGTPERLARVSADVAAGRVRARNLKYPQKAFFLDRDGTINEEDGFVTGPEQIRLIPGAAQAIAAINRSGYLAVVVTNQPVIARGDCTLETLETVNNRLETLLGAEGAYIDALYFCPHHPDSGFEGERPEYKIVCDCRKPSPGMILRAARELHIDVTQSYMVGDRDTDVQAGAAAGCKPVFLGDPAALEEPPAGTAYYASLAELVNAAL